MRRGWETLSLMHENYDNDNLAFQVLCAHIHKKAGGSWGHTRGMCVPTTIHSINGHVCILMTASASHAPPACGPKLLTYLMKK